MAKGRGREGKRGKARAAHDTPPPTCRASSRRGDGHPAKDREDETEQEPEGAEEGGGRDGETPQGAPVEVTRVGGDATPPEENADLLGFHPERAHLLLQGVYDDFLHHNDGLHLDVGIAHEAARQCLWRWLAAQSASWYATPSGAVGCRFMVILAAE